MFLMISLRTTSGGLAVCCLNSEPSIPLCPDMPWQTPNDIPELVPKGVRDEWNTINVIYKLLLLWSKCYLLNVIDFQVYHC